MHENLSPSEGEGEGIQACLSRTPSFRRMSSIRHQRVRADWNRFSPTNAVNSSQ